MKNQASERVKLSRKRKYALNCIKELEGYAREFNRKDFKEKFDSKEFSRLISVITERKKMLHLRFTLVRSLREINRPTIQLFDQTLNKQHEQNFEGCWKCILEIITKRGFNGGLRVLEIREAREAFPDCTLSGRTHRPAKIYLVYVNPP